MFFMCCNFSFSCNERLNISNEVSVYGQPKLKRTYVYVILWLLKEISVVFIQSLS